MNRELRGALYALNDCYVKIDPYFLSIFNVCVDHEFERLCSGNKRRVKHVGEMPLASLLANASLCPIRRPRG